MLVYKMPDTFNVGDTVKFSPAERRRRSEEMKQDPQRPPELPNVDSEGGVTQVGKDWVMVRWREPSRFGGWQRPLWDNPFGQLHSPTQLQKVTKGGGKRKKHKKKHNKNNKKIKNIHKYKH